MQGQIKGFSIQLKTSTTLVSATTAQPAIRYRPRAPLKCVAVAYEEKQATSVSSTLLAAAADGSSSNPRDRELERRQKISAANKGRRPWNKGLHYTDEVRARISRATLLAMQRPDVRARMEEANQHRPPHTEEVKAKIKQSLKDHANRCKAIIADQIDIIIQKIQASNDPELTAMLEYKDLKKALGKAAWHFWKRECDLHDIADNWDTFPEFRTLAKKKVEEGMEKQIRSEANKQRAARRQAAKGKVQSALKTAKKLAHAKTKLAEAEIAVANLQRLKQQLASDPVKYAAAVAAEEQATALMTNLKVQVERLTEALAPLNQYLKLDMEQNGSGQGSAVESAAAV